MKRWWIGCSGFFYKHWREKFYPPGLPQKRWFEYYCEHFNTVELNVTFYRYPKLEALEGWHARSPEHFRFTVKAPRLVTHYKKFHGAKREANDFYLLASRGLREKLGCVLFQLPPNLVYSDENLKNIVETLDASFVNVLEFRHESWWNEKVFEVLKREGITFCGISYPALPDDVMRSVPVLYHRFHGVPDLYASRYSKKALEEVKAKISSFRGVTDAYVYFNNDIYAEAIRNARELIEMASGLQRKTALKKAIF